MFTENSDMDITTFLEADWAQPYGFECKVSGAIAAGWPIEPPERSGGTVDGPPVLMCHPDMLPLNDRMAWAGVLVTHEGLNRVWGYGLLPLDFLAGNVVDINYEHIPVGKTLVPSYDGFHYDVSEYTRKFVGIPEFSVYPTPKDNTRRNDYADAVNTAFYEHANADRVHTKVWSPQTLRRLRFEALRWDAFVADYWKEQYANKG